LTCAIAGLDLSHQMDVIYAPCASRAAASGLDG
jgi:hypothetical protein